MGRRLEARQPKASSSGQGTARLARRKLLQHVKLSFRYGQECIRSNKASFREAIRNYEQHLKAKDAMVVSVLI